jgi:RsiW-degrading membrane proteinase PrsW (M82 family)
MGTLIMPAWFSLLRPPYIDLILGVILFSAAVVWTCTGKARTRFSGWVYRAAEPTQFWWVVAMYFLGGVLFIGIFLHEVYGH